MSLNVNKPLMWKYAVEKISLGLGMVLLLAVAGCGGSTKATLTSGEPTVTSTNPAIGATGVPINRKITAAFSKPMNPATISAATFTLASATTTITGVVAYDAASNIATFAPAANLAANTAFTATITTGAKDLAGNSLASNFVWAFTQPAPSLTPPHPPSVPRTLPAQPPVWRLIRKSLQLSVRRWTLPRSPRQHSP